MDNLLEQVYYGTDSPACFAGARKVYLEAKKRNKKITIKIVKEFLEKQRTYTIFRPARHKYQRLKIIPSGLNVDWQADLIDLSSLSEENSGYKYVLNVIDTLSRMLYAEPVKSKKSDHIIDAFEKIFKKAKVKPWRLMTDRGSEFVAKPLMDYYEKKDIIKKVAYTNDEVKCAMVERANRTIMERLAKYFSEKNILNWVNILDKIVNAINHTVHTTTGVRPVDVKYSNAKNIRLKLLEQNKLIRTSKVNYKSGDYVRIAYRKKTFRKGYMPNFTDEIFLIKKVRKTNPPTYQLVDLQGGEIKGWFYNENLVRTTLETTFRIEKVFKERKRKGKIEYFCKFIGYDNSYNRWISEDEFVA